VADLAVAFGMNVLATSRTQTDQTSRKHFQWKMINELLEEADVVSLHCPLTPETKGLIDQNKLARMKSSAFLLNTSRGPLIIEQDLADALNNDVIAGAALDVLSTEPPSVDNPLFRAKNCILTPHIAWATHEARTRLMKMVVNNVAAFLKGKPMNIVNGYNPFITSV